MKTSSLEILFIITELYSLQGNLQLQFKESSALMTKLFTVAPKLTKNAKESV